MRKTAILSMILIGAFCLMGFGPGEVTGDRHPADSYSNHNGSQGPWDKSSPRDSVLTGKRLPTGSGGGMDMSNIGMRGSKGLRNLGPNTVGNWDMHPADEYNRSCRYGQCATEVVKPAGSPSGGMGGESGRDKFMKKDKKEKLGFNSVSDPRSDKDDYGSRPNQGSDEDKAVKGKDKNKKSKGATDGRSGLSLSAMDKLGRHRVSGDVHPADSYNTTIKEFRQPMKMIDPAKMPYRIYKMFSTNSVYGISGSSSKVESDKISAPEEEKTVLDNLRKKTWTTR